MSMKNEFQKLRCKIVDADEARTTTHREVLLILAQTFDHDDVVLFCEPSVVGARSGSPDIVILDPHSGLHVIEVKGIDVDQVRSVLAGGAIEIAYASGVSRKDPSRQAKQAMFDIKDAASRHFQGELHTPFQSWVAFPRVGRNDWEHRFGEAVPNRSDVLFMEDLESSNLKERMQCEGIERLEKFELKRCPTQQLQSVMAAFGDSEVLRPEPRQDSKPPEGTKGEALAESLAEHRKLTEQQQRLTSRVWDDGPRLLRGVAGSGKTIVLATQAARMIERLHDKEADLFDSGEKPQPVLAVCFNRSLVPFIRQRIEIAYKQRTDDVLPSGSIVVTHLNSLLYLLSQRGYCKYRRVEDVRDLGERTSQYLSDLDTVGGEHGKRLAEGLFHCVYVDEGQDFHELEFSLLLKLCQRAKNAQPRMFVFYDDAQNLYGRQRPTWSDLGLELRGRSVVMDECFRNTRQIVEPAFNLLLGVHADDPQSVKTRSFADTQTLKEKGLIEFRDRHIVVHFSNREGQPVALTSNDTERDEETRVANLCSKLIEEDGLLPQDILVLTSKRHRATEIATAISEKLGEDQVLRPYEETEKDGLAIQSGKISVSTVASAKGYDAPFVIVASLNEFSEDVSGRASLYVACTRAREWLAMYTVGNTDLVLEFTRALTASNNLMSPANP